MPDARSPAGARVVRFGEVEADLGAGEVRRGGSRTVLGEQPLRILLRLIERPGETVTRDELRRELWPGNTFVDFEHGLNSAIKRLRDALGDSADAPRYVETLPRRGYRFIAPIDNGLPATLSPSGAAGEVTGPRPTVLSRRVVVGALLLASAATVAGWLALGPSRSRPSVSAVTPAATTATNLVAVAAFDNRTGDPSLAPLGPLTAGRLIRAISRVESAAVHPEPIRTGSKAVPSGVGEDPVQVAGRLGAALAVAGAYYLRGDRVEFQARIVDARTGKLLYSAPPAAAARAEPAAALEEIEQAIAGAVAIHFDHAFGGLEITSVPPLLDAYLEYQAGRELFERDYTRLLAHLRNRHQSEFRAGATDARDGARQSGQRKRGGRDGAHRRWGRSPDQGGTDAGGVPDGEPGAPSGLCGARPARPGETRATQLDCQLQPADGGAHPQPACDRHRSVRAAPAPRTTSPLQRLAAGRAGARAAPGGRLRTRAERGSASARV